MTAAEITASAEPRSLWSDARRALMRNRAAMTAAVVLVLMALAVTFGPLLIAHPFDRPNWDSIALPPSPASGHLFGTDSLGRDLLARTLQGGRISLLVGVVATLVSLVIGVSWGAVAGFVGGRTDRLMMRIVDILYALPFMFLVIC